MIKIFICILITANLFGQGHGFYGDNGAGKVLLNYKYSPSTDTAINITNFSATLVGNDGKTKSNKLDTLATKKTPQRWIVWQSNEDSLVMVFGSNKVLGNGWYADFDRNLDTIFVNSGMVGYPARFKFNRDATIRYSMKVINYVSGTVNIGSLFGEDEFVDTLDGNGTYSGVVTIENTYFTFSASGNAEMGITSFEFDILADSLSGKKILLTGLQPNTDYTYYYSMLVKANDGDLDYHRGETKTFTTLILPTEELLRTEDLIYVTTEDDKYIQFEGE